MSAAEFDLNLESSNRSSSYLSYARDVFDIQTTRWDMGTCNGGLTWNFPDVAGRQSAEPSGYMYKDSFSNGILSQLAARLARFTGNQTYIDWVNKVWDWSRSAGLITPDYEVYDGIEGIGGCDDPNPLQWTSNAALFLYGSALMFNQTNGDTQWHNRTQSLLSSMNRTFFTGETHLPIVGPGAPSNVMVEVACEYVGGTGEDITCTPELSSFKGLAAQWMGPTVQAAPFLATPISTGIQNSAKAAGSQCSTGANGTICGFRWAGDEVGEFFRFGTQLSALSIVMANLASSSKPPVTAKTTTLEEITDAQEDSTGSSSQCTRGSRAETLLMLMTLTAILLLQ
ncbi:MAG: hypothetical protein Q9169_001916 [Polycauliona sp. 2 TL-2023]